MVGLGRIFITVGLLGGCFSAFLAFFMPRSVLLFLCSGDVTECYPEWFFMLFALPTSILVASFAGWIVGIGRSKLSG
jgi:hypothetical protein